MSGYIDFSYPLWLVSEVQKRNNKKSTPDSWWLSQPRKDSDSTTEAIVVTFQSMVGISQISFDLLQVGCDWELWYWDRNNNLKRVWDRSAQHVHGRVNHSKRQSFEWGKYTRMIHPIVARALELRIRRIPASPDLGITDPYSVGVRELWAKRNIFDRDDATRPFEDEVDLLGNLVSKTVVDWDPKKALDGDDYSFWKSGPQPSSDAVVNFFLDCRVPNPTHVFDSNNYPNPSFEEEIPGFESWRSDEWSSSGNYSLEVPESYEDPFLVELPAGSTMLISARDPGQEIFIDDAIEPDADGDSTRFPYFTTSESEERVRIFASEDISLELGTGFWDDLLISEGEYEGDYFDGDSENSDWLGTPHNSASVRESVIVKDSPQSITSVFIDPVYTGQDLNVYFSNDEATGRGVLSSLNFPSEISIDAMWKKGVGITLPQNDSKVIFDLSKSGFEIGESWWVGFEFSTLWGSSDPVSYDLASFDGMSLQTSNGKFSLFDQEFEEGSEFVAFFCNAPSKREVRLYRDGSLIGTHRVAPSTQTSGELIFGRGMRIKAIAAQQGQEGQEFEKSLWNFAQDPVDFFSPEEPTEDSNLRDIVVGGDLRLSEHPRGGLESSVFEDKTWIPIWKDFVVRRGKLIFPKPVLAKYLKLEFSNLTEQPYPVWESGIETTYKTFPISVTESLKTVSTTQTTRTTTATRRSDSNVTQTRTTSFTTTPKVTSTYDTQISYGRPELSGVLKTYDRPISSSIVKEVADSTIYKRQSQSSRTIAKDKFYTVVSGDWLIKIGKKLDIPWKEIYNANRAMIDNDPRVKMLPRRSPGWWIFPGQQLRISSKIMEMITTSEVKTERKETTLARKRFETTSVHRYDTQTVTRDAAIAYFAGIREIKLFTTNYVTDEDSNYVIYDIPQHFSVVEGDIRIDEELGVHPTATPTVLQSEVFPSLSPFRRLSLATFDRGLQRPFRNISSLYALGSTIDLQGDYVFDGELTVRVVKNESDHSVEAGLKSPSFHIPDKSQWRVGGRIHRTRSTSSKFVVRVRDSEENIIFEQNVSVDPGGWVDFNTKFSSFLYFYEDASLEFVAVGDEEEVFYVHSLYVEMTTTVWEASNDGGRNFFEITDAIYPQKDFGYFQFPNSDNRLVFRITMRGETDYVFGLEANPKYEADRPPLPFGYVEGEDPITIDMFETITDDIGYPVSFNYLEATVPSWTINDLREGTIPDELEG